MSIFQKYLDIYIHETNFSKRYENTDEGISLFLSENSKPDVVLFEASGGYERLFLQKLFTADWPICLINPRQVRDYAKSKGIFAKTDVLDAKILAEFPTAIPVSLINTLQHFELKDLLQRRYQLKDAIKLEKQHLSQTNTKTLYNKISEIIDVLQKQLKEIDILVSDYISECSDLQERVEIITSIKGIGLNTAQIMVSEMPELGTINHGAAACLLGVAPFAHDSGYMVGKRHIRGGRKKMRCALYMATLTAIRYNKDISIFYQRLIKAGKSFKQAITASMRKIIILTNALLRDGRYWSEKTPI